MNKYISRDYSILSKVICKTHAFLIKFLACILEINKFKLKSIWECLNLNDIDSLLNMDQSDKLTIPNFNMHYKARVIR